MKTVIYPIVNGNYTDSHVPLLMSLRSIEKFLKADFRVVVISEKIPQYLSAEVNYVECSSYRHALQLACTLDYEFLWMNDDICLLREWTWEELKVWKRGRGEVLEDQQEKMAEEGGGWAKRKSQVLTKLRGNGHTTYDFSTHTPYVYRAAALRTVLSDYDFGYKTPFETAYGNIVHGHDSVVLDCLLSRHHAGFLPVDISPYGLLNYDDKGFTDHMVGFLLGMFPKPSRFEDLGSLTASKTLINQIK